MQISRRKLAYIFIALALLLVSLHGFPFVRWKEYSLLHIPILALAVLCFGTSIYFMYSGDKRAAESIAQRAIQENERELRHAQQAAHDAKYARDHERRVHEALARALEVFQRSRVGLLRQLGEVQDHAAAVSAWDSCCDASLAAVVALWRALYFDGSLAVRVRATLFRVQGDQVVPLRRSGGNTQGNPAQTTWRRGHGIAGRVVETGTPGFFANIPKELNKAQKERRAPFVAIEREEHMQIQSLYCLPVRQPDYRVVVGVCCIDADRILPETAYRRNDPAHASVPVHIFMGEFLYLLELRSYLQERYA